MAELAWQLSRYLSSGSVNFKINSRPLFIIIFKLKNDNFKTQDFSSLIERVLAGVGFLLENLMSSSYPTGILIIKVEVEDIGFLLLLLSKFGSEKFDSNKNH